jgi:hypothetical protein
MNLAGIFLMVFIFSIVYYIVSMPVAQKGGEETELTLKQSESIYARQFNELHDVNNVLKRPIKPVDETTDHLVGFESSVPSESRPAELQAPDKTVLKFNIHPVAPEITPELRQRVKARQPYFLRKPYIKTKYGKNYYADANYPLFLVDTAFAEDPAKFIKERPREYPSYVIISRTPNGEKNKIRPTASYASYEPKI